MMDEFRDTSLCNGKTLPIGEESGTGKLQLIVGDVKQSIYRFRNSDWRLLGEQVQRDFHPESMVNHLLDTNWRSDAQVVGFNNSFFKNAAQHLQNDYNAGLETIGAEAVESNRDTQIIDAYADVHQHVPEGRDAEKGQVKVTFLKDDRESDWKEEALERLPLEIEELQKQGFALNEIAVVVRWNHEAVRVAETLLTYKEQHPDSPYRYDIISNEALLIGSARSVKTAIALLRHFQNPNDASRRMVGSMNSTGFITAPERGFRANELKQEEFPEPIQDEMGSLSTMPFYDMIERFLDHLGSHR